MNIRFSDYDLIMTMGFSNNEFRRTYVTPLAYEPGSAYCRGTYRPLTFRMRLLSINARWVNDH